MQSEVFSIDFSERAADGKKIWWEEMTMSKKIKETEYRLLNCPFCGGAAEAVDGSAVNDGDQIPPETKPYWIRCSQCDFGTNGDTSEKQAAQKWNDGAKILGFSFDQDRPAATDKQKLLEFCKTLYDVPRPNLTDPDAKLLWDIFFDKFATLVNDLGRDAGKL